MPEADCKSQSAREALLEGGKKYPFITRFNLGDTTNYEVFFLSTMGLSSLTYHPMELNSEKPEKH
jgi:hypothetical protein